MGGREADECSARQWIKMRSALAHQVRRPESALGASWNCRGFSGHAFVGIAAVVFAGAKAITEPTQRQSSGLCYAHNVPAAGYGMAESMQAAFGVKRRAISSSKNYSGCADGGADDSGARDAHADRPCSLIASSGDQRRTCTEAGCDCANLRNSSANLLGFEESWEQ